MSETGRTDATGFVAGVDRMKTPGEFLSQVKNEGGIDGGEGGSVPLDTEWTKSSFSNGSGGNNCVEVRASGTQGWVLMRNSKDPEGGVLAFTREEWTSFLAGVIAGEFDL